MGMLCAKSLYILLYWKNLSQLAGTSIGSLYASAGYSSLGVFFGYILAIFLFVKLRIKRISFLKVADYGIPFTFLVQAFIKVGCLAGGCCYGKPTDLPWGVIFPGQTEVPVHPTQLYSMLYLLFVFFIGRYIYKKGPPVGITFFGSIFLYSVLRYLNELLRVDSVNMIGTITLAQIAVIATACMSGAALIIVLLTRRRT